MATKTNAITRMRTPLRRAPAPTLSLPPTTSRRILESTSKATRQVAILSDMMEAYRIAERHAALCAASKKPEDAPTRTIKPRDVATLLHTLNVQMQHHIQRLSNTLSALAAQVSDATEDLARQASSGPDDPNL